MPEHINSNSKLVGIEYDILTSKLVKGIYPDVEIINDGLQNIDFEGKKYDLIIGNPPYSDEKMTDNFMSDLSGYTIHHYFTAKCMRLLRDNGILAFVVPSFYMDIPRSNTRHTIDKESVIVDVIRLPENMFDQAKVTVDILLIRKTGNKIHDITKSIAYTKEGNSDYINNFWIKNPHRILGSLKLKWVKTYNRFVPTCEADDKDKVLQYLDSCQFDNTTIDNYNRIIKTSNQAIITKISDDMLLNHLRNNFTAIEELEVQAESMKNQLSKLHADTWLIYEQINRKAS